MKPIIIIGAARSGTNMLRDTICQLNDFATWDCDEINPIWRHGNLDHPNDYFNHEMATPKVKKFVRSRFEKIGRFYSVQNVVEKSCANSLRVSFINEIFPDAKFIFIYRDGRDTVASSKLRWKSTFDLKYTLKKLRYVPITDLPYYALRFGMNRIKKVLSGKENLGFWGVHIPGLEEYVRKHTIEEVCAHQWKACVEQSLEDFKNISEDRVYRIRYEDFVHDPVRGMEDLCTFLKIHHDAINLEALTSKISSKSIGKYKTQLSSKQIGDIEGILKNTLQKLDYA